MFKRTVWKINFIFFLQFFLFALFLFGCTTTESKIESLAASKQCEDAEKELTDLSVEVEALGTGKKIIGTFVTLPLLAAGYTVDFFTFAFGNVIMPVFVCGTAIPVDILLLSRGRSGFPMVGACSEIINKGVGSKNNSSDKHFEKGLGSKISSATEDIRAVDFTKMSSAIRKIASCYIARNKDKDLEKADTLLDQAIGLRVSGKVDSKEVVAVSELSDDLGKRLGKFRQKLSSQNQESSSGKSGKTESKLIGPTHSDKILFGHWVSQEGTILDGGAKPELSGKQIAGEIEIYVSSEKLILNKVFKTEFDLSFPKNIDIFDAFDADVHESQIKRVVIEYEGAIEQFKFHSEDLTKATSIKYIRSMNNLKVKRFWTKVDQREQP